MNVIFYILIGILLAFLFVFLNKVIEKHENKTWVDYIKWMRVDDETGLALVCICIVFLWPILLAFLGFGGLSFGVVVALYGIGSGIYKVFNWICNKILK